MSRFAPWKAIALAACLGGPHAAADDPAADPVSYARDVAPFLEEHCLACHEDGAETSGLRLDSLEMMLKGGRKGPAIAPGRGAESLIVRYMTGQDQPRMPPEVALPLDQIDLIRRWIDAGAKVDEAEAGREAVARRARERAEAEREAAAFAGDAPPAVAALAYSPDGAALAVAADREVLILDPADGSVLRRLVGFPDAVTALAYSPDGARLAAGGGAPGRSGEVRVWDARSWSELRTLRGHADAVHALAWRPGADELATASLDKLILVWDLASGEPSRTIKGHADVVHALAYSPDGARLASASADRTAKLFDAADGRQLAGLSTHNDAVTAVAFSPDGKYLATGSADRGMALWALDNLDNPLRGFGHTGPVTCLAWRPDSSSLWAGSGGRPSLLSYKAENGDRAAPIDESTLPPDWVYAVALAPDGRAVAAAGWDGAVTLWGLDDGRVLLRCVPGRAATGADR